MKNKQIALTITIIVFMSGLLHGQFIALNGGGTVTNNLTAITSTDSVVDFYNYQASNFNYNGSYVIPEQSINTFLFQEDGGPLSFVTIYGKNPNPTGTNNPYEATTEVLLEGTTAAFSVQDDPPPARDIWASSGGTSFSATNFWSTDKTDGFAITDITGFTKLTQTMGLSDYSTWLLHSANEADPFVLTLDTNLVITPVPEPSTIGLMVLAGLPLALLVRRRLIRK